MSGGNNHNPVCEYHGPLMGTLGSIKKDTSWLLRIGTSATLLVIGFGTWLVLQVIDIRLQARDNRNLIEQLVKNDSRHDEAINELRATDKDMRSSIEHFLRGGR